MNIPIHGLSSDDAIQEQYEMDALYAWDASKAEIVSIVEQFGWSEVNTYLRSIRPDNLVFVLLEREGQEQVVSFDDLADKSLPTLIKAKAKLYPGWRLVESW